MYQQAPHGWYPDPAGSGMLRYFDGAQWTEQTAPLHTFAANTGPSHPAPPQPAGHGQLPYGTQPEGGQQYHHSAPLPPPAAAPRRRRTGLLITIIAVSVLVLGAGGFVAVQYLGAEDSADNEHAEAGDAPDDDETDVQHDDETDAQAGDSQAEADDVPADDRNLEDASPIPVGGLTQEIAPEEVWSGQVTVQEEASILLQTWSEVQDLDWTLQVSDAGGALLATLEPEPGTDFIGSGFVTAMDLGPGDYVVSVRQDGSEPALIGVLAEPTPQTIEPGHEEVITLDDSVYVARQVEIADAGDYYVEAELGLQSPILTIVGGDGQVLDTVTGTDNSGVLDLHLEPGRYVLLISRVDSSGSDDMTFQLGQ